MLLFSGSVTHHITPIPLSWQLAVLHEVQSGCDYSYSDTLLRCVISTLLASSSLWNSSQSVIRQHRPAHFEPLTA